MYIRICIFTIIFMGEAAASAELRRAVTELCSCSLIVRASCWRWRCCCCFCVCRLMLPANTKTTLLPHQVIKFRWKFQGPQDTNWNILSWPWPNCKKSEVSSLFCNVCTHRTGYFRPPSRKLFFQYDTQWSQLWLFCATRCVRCSTSRQTAELCTELVPRILDSTSIPSILY